jgi:hypothetical protein
MIALPFTAVAAEFSEATLLIGGVTEYEPDVCLSGTLADNKAGTVHWGSMWVQYVWGTCWSIADA